MLSTLRTKILRSGRVSNSTGLLLVLICFALASQGCAVQLAMLESKSLINPQIAQVPVQELKSIHAYLDTQNFRSETARIDFIREWVNQNSIHLIDKQHDKYAFNTPQVLSMLWATHQTKENPAHLSCGPRTLAMQAILNELGIQNRMVIIFTDNYPQVRSHTFLEVFNRETLAWEIQDPDFNLYYTNLQTQARVATADLLWGNLETMAPSSQAGTGWEVNEVVHLKQDYFEAMMYMDYAKAKQSIILINANKFQPTEVFEKNSKLTFYKFANKHYKQPIFIIKQDVKGVVSQTLYKSNFFLWWLRTFNKISAADKA